LGEWGLHGVRRDNCKVGIISKMGAQLFLTRNLNHGVSLRHVNLVLELLRSLGREEN